MAGQETEWQVAVAQAANAAKGLGDLPGALARLVESVVSPPPDCWEVLREFVNRRAKNDFCPSRPSRRYLPHGVYLPSLWSEELGDIVVMIDCSGSIGQAELDVFAGHMQTILEHFRCTATVVYHDIPVTWVQHWSPDDGPFKLEHHGGGGTSHVPVFQWLANYLDVESVEVPCVIAFTDLDTRLPDRAPDVPVLWAAYGNPYWRKEPPFGEIVNLHF